MLLCQPGVTRLTSTPAQSAEGIAIPFTTFAKRSGLWKYIEVTTIVRYCVTYSYCNLFVYNYRQVRYVYA